MPIKPENRKLYPPNWKQISEDARERARLRCQHNGCTAKQYDVGLWEERAGTLHWRSLLPADDRFWLYSAAKQCAAETQWSHYGDDPEAPKVIVIVLTVAHLNHDPADCRPENLAAMCQRHHLAYDQQHHNESAYATRMAKRGNMELPL